MKYCNSGRFLCLSFCSYIYLYFFFYPLLAALPVVFFDPLFNLPFAFEDPWPCNRPEDAWRRGFCEKLARTLAGEGLAEGLDGGSE